VPIHAQPVLIGGNMKDKKYFREYSAKFRAAHPEKNREYQKKWRDGNRAKLNAAVAAWAEENKDRIKANNAARYQKDKERITARNKKHRQEHPEASRARVHKRRAIISRSGGSYTAAEWKELCKKYGNRCLDCGKRRKLTADHVIPIAKGGTSNIDNIQPLCMPCNAKKHTGTKDFRITLDLNTTKLPIGLEDPNLDTEQGVVLPMTHLVWQATQMACGIHS
jgi:5-methylcytosine-specific restriction endonuclease McrA